MESEGVSLSLIQEHLMLPWNDLQRGDCCGRLGFTSRGYYCKSCDFFVHRICVDESPEYIDHPSHSVHTLKLLRKSDNICDLCGRDIKNLCYRCEMCEFDVDLYCAKYPPPEVIDISEMHHHKLTLLKEWIYFDCNAKCEKDVEGYPYKCHECDVAFHVDCVCNPAEAKHPSEYTTLESGGVSLPLIHEHLMMPWNALRKGDCCGCLGFTSGGYYCKSCDFFVHRKCGESPEYIEHPSHSVHTLELLRKPDQDHVCDLFYRSEMCDFDVGLFCAKYQPPDVIYSSRHDHKLTFIKEVIEFDCSAKCGKVGKGFPYKCHECDVSFHVDCLWNLREAKHPSELGYALCLKPPPQSVLDLKIHAHQLILLPRLDSFTCNACGLKEDRSRYVCFQCGFMIHQDCFALPRLININRHDHRVSHTSVLGVVNSVCGVCHQKVDWTWGGYSCQRCPQYVVHSKCATRKDVWNGKELEGV